MRIWRRRPPERWIRENTLLWGDMRLLRAGDKGNFIVFGVQGTGKTTSIIIYMKSIFEFIPDGLDVFNAFVFDPKNDFYRTLLAMDLGMPVILGNVLDRRGWAWNMHADIREPFDAWQFARGALEDDGRPGGSSSKFYDESPRHRFGSTLREFVRLGRPWSLREAYLVTMDDFYARQLCEHSADPQVRDSLKFMNRDARETWGNISMSLVTKLQNLATFAALMDRVPPGRRYSLRKMVRNEAVMVFGGDFKYDHILMPMNMLILKLLKQELLGQENTDEPGAEGRRHHVIIDEFPNLSANSPAEDFTKFVEVGRSKGVRACIAAHTPQQLVRLYGREGADIVIGLCQHKLVFRIGDYAGAECLSNYLGWIHEHEWVRNVTESQTSGQGPSSTRGRGASEQWADRRLVHPDELMDLPFGDWESGLTFFGIAPTPAGTLRWRGFAAPGFIAANAASPDAGIPSYESCRRPGEEQYLRPLHPKEVEKFGLEFDPDGYRP